MPKKRRAEATWIEARSRWQINVQRDGKRKTFTSSIPGRKGKHEAEGKADDWLDAGQPDDVRFDRAWEMYLDHIKKTTGTANYHNNESIGRIWLLPTLQIKRLSRIRLSDLQEIVTGAAEEGRAYKTCANIRSKLSGFYAFAANQKWEVDEELPAKISIPSKALKGKKKVAQPDQIRTVFTKSTEICRGKERECFYIHAFRFFIIGGTRSGELCGIRKSDIVGNALIINRSINRYKEVRQGKNDNARRTIPLTSYAKKVLRDQMDMLQRFGIDSEWLFPDKEGNPIFTEYIYKRWRFYAKQHGIDTSIHELRHTFVSLTQNTLPEPLLKRIVGHSASMDTDGVYGHEMDGDLKLAVDMMETLLDNVIGQVHT